jgi:hypothetical protein
MTAPITSAAGTAEPLASGGLLVHMGDAWPRWVPDRATAREVLWERAQALDLKRQRAARTNST